MPMAALPRRRFLGVQRSLLALLVITTAQPAARASEAAAWEALRSGLPVVALMRHADAPGIGDPPGWRLDDCRTQRNLSAQGRAEAKAAGDRFRAERVAFPKVISSPWCRCVDTATLIGAGAVQPEPAFSNAFVQSDQRSELAQSGRRVIAAWKGPGALLVVTHGANIQALTGHSPASGEVVVVSADAPAGALRTIGSIPVPAAPR